MDITIRKYEKHPSIQMITQNFGISKKFSFKPVSKDEVKKTVKDPKYRRKTYGRRRNKSVGGEIPSKIFKECDFTFEILTQCINKFFTSREFQDCFKQANVEEDLYLRKMIL